MGGFKRPFFPFCRGLGSHKLKNTSCSSVALGFWVLRGSSEFRVSGIQGPSVLEGFWV